MQAFEDEEGLVFWPEHEVASLTPERGGRVRAVFLDGSVAHARGPFQGPWVPLGEAFVYPPLLKRTDQGWRDPADFLFPPGKLSEVLAPPASPFLENPGCSAEEVRFLRATPHETCVWETVRGPIP